MLSPDDARLLARGTDLPGARILLDPELVSDLVEKAATAAWGPLVGVRVEYLRYKPGTSLVAGITAETADGLRRAYAVAGSPRARAKLAKTVDRGSRALDDFAPQLTEDLLLVAPLSSDRAVRGVDQLLRAPGDVVRGAVSAETLRYRPGRRAVVRVDGPEGPLAVVRAYPGRHQSAVEQATPLFKEAGVRVPRLRAVRRGGRMLVLQHLDGVPATTESPDGLLVDIGQVLARLQRAGSESSSVSSGASPLRPADHHVAARAALRAIEALVPGCADLAGRTVDVALGSLALLPGSVVPSHGDFSRDQILLGPRGPAVLDLDRAGLDRPAADVAAWFAADVAAGGIGPCQEPQQTLEPMTRSLLAHTRPEDREAVAADLRGALSPLVALALLRRAVEPFRLRADSGAWLARTTALVEGAAHQVGLHR